MCDSVVDEEGEGEKERNEACHADLLCTPLDMKAGHHERHINDLISALMPRCPSVEGKYSLFHSRWDGASEYTASTLDIEFDANWRTAGDPGPNLKREESKAD